jgi:hypothetical protein
METTIYSISVLQPLFNDESSFPTLMVMLEDQFLYYLLWLIHPRQIVVHSQLSGDVDQVVWFVFLEILVVVLLQMFVHYFNGYIARVALAF